MARAEALTRLTEEEKAIVEANVGLVYKIAREMPQRRLTSDDRVQVGMFGLMRAVQKYVPGKGVLFSTYASSWIKSAIGKREHEDGLIRTPIWAVYPSKAAKLKPRVKARLADVENSRRVASLDLDDDGLSIGSQVASRVEGPSAAIEASDETARVQSCVDGLEPLHREILTSRYWGGETLKQIGRRIGCGRDAVVATERLALRTLRKILDPELAKGA